MNATPKIPASDDAWESSQLGVAEQYVKPDDENIETKVDDALELQMISIRLQKSLIEDCKLIARMNGLGYQTLMRQVLKRFVDAEKKKILRDLATEMELETKVQQAKARQAEAKQTHDSKAPLKRKAA
jgi:uncharacterized protein (DUF4415 family)